MHRTWSASACGLRCAVPRPRRATSCCFLVTRARLYFLHRRKVEHSAYRDGSNVCSNSSRWAAPFIARITRDTREHEIPSPGPRTTGRACKADDPRYSARSSASTQELERLTGRAVPMYRPSDVTKVFRIKAGILVRWKIVADIKAIAREQGLAIVSERSGRTTRFDLTGPGPDVDRFIRAIDEVQGAGTTRS